MTDTLTRQDSGPVTTSDGGCEYVSRVHNSKTSKDLQDIYDKWADQFNDDIAKQDYVAPKYVAEAILDNLGKVDGDILDAGCGTGLSGIALAQVGCKNIDGVDLSTGMLKVAAKTGLYRSLAPADLSKPIEKQDDTYDVVTCVGTLTHGHVDPKPALEEFIRITKPGGLIVATIIDDIWATHGYEAEVKRLQDAGLAEVLSTESKAYRQNAGVYAKILVLRKRIGS
ncbi:Methyltransferase-like protein 27 [Fulvia fulva]|uniref:Methyltransferase-like protein 27 n=1 Tax=Passalora fulva TaxID=5499 RepID=A0A9Q8PAW1_PASFU|nr:Methyltransferase-like protein 27 [Fulvia fulva]KAK4622015.1 Methyltransferase-like protein 27 [Fulvia fulva]KAK4623337.1 Methyltransferase-like protein 27 [Fulvia fulva]UJO19100.1 Methyltransferase-like protein 27 [Fulvia fulva]WPV16449.1 Methyltransferase-like protein 27 [Fulvia fulva]WPV30747.1 Methyltransferase-like protein 27 [Fulvia fulva]